MTMKFGHRVVVSGSVVVTFIIGSCIYFNGNLVAPVGRRSESFATGMRSLFGTFADGFECDHHRLHKSESDFDTLDMLSKLTNRSIHMEEDNLFGYGSTTSSKPKEKRYSGRSILQPSPKSPNHLLKVIIMPHSHNDPGWLETLSNYWNTKTKKILDNMLLKLTQYPRMTFIWSETVFLAMWFKDLTDDQKTAFKRLLNRGQVEICTGGWVMPDEASTHFSQLVDQMTEGHQWLENHLGYKVKNNWANDPFGHSVTMPFLLKLAGYENMAILRIHQGLKNQLAENRSLGFHWRQRWAPNNSTDMYCHVDPYHYTIRDSCGPDVETCEEVDFHHSPNDWASERLKPLAQDIVSQWRLKSDNYAHNVVLMLAGDDFRYDTENEWDSQYNNWISLIDYMNANHELNVNVQFGTLKDFFNVVRKEICETKQDVAKLTGDFYPYSEKRNEYWTGYFTTRPFTKYTGRVLARHLRSAEILNSLAYGYSKALGKQLQPIDYNISKSLTSARRGLGVFQHHDAITGTSPDKVAEDYEKTLHRGLNIAKRVLSHSIATLMGTKKVEFVENGAQPSLHSNVHRNEFGARLQPSTYPTLNISVKGDVIYVYNSLAKWRSEPIHVLVPTPRVGISKLNSGDGVRCQVNVVMAHQKLSSALFELVFVADLPPFGISTFFIQSSSRKEACTPSTVQSTRSERKYRTINSIFQFNDLSIDEDSNIENGEVVVTVNPQTGLLKYLTNKASLRRQNVNMGFYKYTDTDSGAYIFNPTSNKPTKVRSHNENYDIIIQRGSVVSQVYALWGKQLEFTIRLYNNIIEKSRAVEIQNLLLKTQSPCELVMKFKTEIQNNKTFYTDSNGFQMVRRHVNTHLSVAANYYPMTNMMFIEDRLSRISVLSAQPHGVTSVYPGELEVALEHKTVVDDDRGMSMPVNENHFVPSRFVLLVESPPFNETRGALHDVSRPTTLAQMTSLKLEHHPFVLRSTFKNTPKISDFSPLAQPLPCDIHVVNFRRLTDADDLPNGKNMLTLHKLENWCRHGEEYTTCLGGNPNVIPNTLFRKLTVKTIEEWTLSLMHKKANLSPFQPLLLNPWYAHSYKLELK